MEGDEGNDDLDHLSCSIQAELSKLPTISPNRCIFKAPTTIREVNERSYTPAMVSIGPFHHNNKKLLPMEVHKLSYLKSFLDDSKQNASLKDYLKIAKDAETKIREFYADPTSELSSYEFNRMVLIDSAFLIELFRRNFKDRIALVYPNKPSLKKDDHICGRPYKMGEVIQDIKLLENQLPFMVLVDLYRTAFKPNGSTVPYFTDLACRFLHINTDRIDLDASTREANCFHLLDLVRTHYLPSKTREDGVVLTRRERKIMCPSVTGLHEAGVKFQAARENSHSLLDVRFDKDKGVLTIPSLKIVDRTEPLFRNLAAFELCYYKNDTYIADYLFFTGSLIETARDVELLVDAGIIENWLGSEKDVACLFNTIGKHTYVFPYLYYYGGITEQLNGHCHKSWNRYRATLKHTYFRHPWAVISVLYAAVLLILTVVQVVTGIIDIPY